MAQPTQRPLTIARLIPNVVTLGALCCGLTAMRMAIVGRWELAAMFIVIAAFLDGMDGRLARLLKASSQFGAQLDSLSDIVCFGVAPAMIMYHWQLQGMKGIGWMMALFYAVCCALRLARFNTALVDEKPPEAWEKKFFTGVPSPAGAMLALLPLTATLALGEGYADKPWIVALTLPLAALIMASRWPTFAPKGWRITPPMVLPVMIGFGFFVASIVIQPWETIAIVSVGYLVSLPISAFVYWRNRRR